MLDTLLTTSNLACAGAILAVITTIKKMFPKIGKKKWAQRLMPVLPLVLGVIGGLVGATDGQTIQDKVTVGLVCGFFAGHVFKIGRTTVMGAGVVDKVEEAAAPKTEKKE